MCYRDRSYCDARCAPTDCDRNITDDVLEAARKWWADMPGEPPFCVFPYSKGCNSFIPVEAP